MVQISANGIVWSLSMASCLVREELADGRLQFWRESRQDAPEYTQHHRFGISMDDLAQVCHCFRQGNTFQRGQTGLEIQLRSGIGRQNCRAQDAENGRQVFELRILQERDKRLQAPNLESGLG